MPSPEHEAVIAALQASPIDSSMTFADQRAFYEAAVGGAPVPDDIDLTTIEIAGREVDLLRAEGGDKNSVILHLHGGGYVIGSHRMYRDFAARLARATGRSVMVPDYRLAPENKFPAALDDAVASYAWLLDQGVAASQIALSGDSAGGGLALSTLMTIRDRGLSAPGAGVLISPWTDLELTGDSCRPGAVDDPIMDLQNLANMAQAYADDELGDARVSPIRGQVEDLPPVIIFAGTRELLLDDARRLAEALRKIGAAPQYVEGEGLVHCWAVMAPTAPESAQCLADVGRFLDLTLTS